MEWGKEFLFWGDHAVLLGVWVALALSLNLINGCTGLFSLGHQGFWAVGAYTVALLLPQHAPGAEGAAPGLGAFLLSFPAAVLVAALFGLLVGLPCLRMRGDYLAIATLGFAEIFRHLANDSPWLGGSRGLKVHNVVRSLAVELQGFPPAASTSGMPEAQAQALRNALDRAGYAEMAFYLVLSWGAVALIWCLLLRLMRSGHGRAIRAIRDDEAVAELMGVNLTRYKVLVFVLGAGLAGLAGAIYAHTRRYPTPDQFNFMQGVTIVAMVVLGGMGSFSGTVLAAAVIYLLPVLLSFAPEAWRIPVFYDPTQGGLVERSPKDLWQVFFALVLITVILVRPQGLLGRRELSPGALWRRLRRGSFRAAAGGAP